jgi:CxxC motif-containing protein (DUF1111 family)
MNTCGDIFVDHKTRFTFNLGTVRLFVSLFIRAESMNRFLLLSIVCGLVSNVGGQTSTDLQNATCHAETVNEIDKRIDALSETDRLAMGKELFKRDWSTFDHKKGDGLGPFYNNVSCVACHKDGGVGGAGGNQHNVDLLSIRSPRPHPNRATDGFIARIQKLHPAFNRHQLSIVLHKFGKDSSGWLVNYKNFRQIALLQHSKRPLSPDHPIRSVSRMQLELAQRNTPPLFGAGLVNQVTARQLIELAERQKKSKLGISGRIPQTSSGAVGRFGWRGQISTLEDFVLGACANELGLTVPGNPQPSRPALVVQDRSRKKTTDNPRRAYGVAQGFDLSMGECRTIAEFISNLPKPKIVNGTTLMQSQDAVLGEKLFAKVGCVECHVENVGPATGIYSDMLLHDMGPKLADSVSAVPEITKDDILPGSSGGYFGASAQILVKNITTNIKQEWRTPPLWGVRDSAPYMHDGRAKTLHLAIEAHGGEASQVVKNYRALKIDDQHKLLTFLHMLAARNGKPQHFFMENRMQVIPGGGGGGGGGFFSTEFDSPDFDRGF